MEVVSIRTWCGEKLKPFEVELLHLKTVIDQKSSNFPLNSRLLILNLSRQNFSLVICSFASLAKVLWLQRFHDIFDKYTLHRYLWEAAGQQQRVHVVVVYLFDVVDFGLLFSLEAPSKDAVREVCVQSHKGPSRQLTESTAATFSIPAGQAAQVTHTPAPVCVCF